MLLDTSGLLCLHHAGEQQHAAAFTFFDAARSRLTHSYVLAEFIALAHARGLPRAEALAFVADLQDSPEVTVIYVDEVVHREALSLLQERADKVWSLCDAVSMILMQEYGLSEALTTDRHFEQAGFVRLL
jgi:uncharacterized protein